MAQASTRGSSYAEILSCPLFREGYDQIWRCREHSVDLRWIDSEQLSYERGRQFGIYVMTEEERHVPLMKGGIPHPRAITLLIMAFRSESVL